MSTSGVKLEDDIKQRLKSLGEKMDRSPHWLMKDAIETYLADKERYWKEREEDMQAWQNYVVTGDGIPQEQVEGWLESIGTENELKCPK